MIRLGFTDSEHPSGLSEIQLLSNSDRKAFLSWNTLADLAHNGEIVSFPRSTPDRNETDKEHDKGTTACDRDEHPGEGSLHLEFHFDCSGGYWGVSGDDEGQDPRCASLYAGQYEIHTGLN
jgi:hypothetical protein